MSAGDNDPSTNSILGKLTRELGIDQISISAPLGEDGINLDDVADVLQRQPSFEPVQNPTQVVDSDTNIVFKLIEDIVPEPEDLAQTTNSSASPQQQQLQTQILNIKAEADANTIKAEADEMMSNITGFGQANPSPMQQLVHSSAISKDAHGKILAHLKILEQPAENKLRFRYECEGRSAGALQGKKSTHDNRTYPTIKVEGYTGPAVCVVSLVEVDRPHRTHPHNLVGRDGQCKQGVCSVEISKPDMTYAFQNLGIQCVRKKDAPESLKRRKAIKVDPFKQGFDHANAAIDLNSVRLCFWVFIKTRDMGTIPLEPVVSEVVKDRKAHSDLQIVDYSDDCAAAEGGKKILLFCEKITRDDIEVHFTMNTKGGEQIYKRGEFTGNDVHKLCGISLRTPPYVDLDIQEPVRCSMYLYKPKAKQQSEPVDFTFYPTGQQEGKMFPPAAPPTHGSSSSPAKSASKRGRDRGQAKNEDEPSSGQVAAPPTRIRTQGGVVSVVSDGAAVGAEGYSPTGNFPAAFRQQQQQDLAHSPYSHVTLDDHNRFVMAPGTANAGGGGGGVDPLDVKPVIGNQQQQADYQRMMQHAANMAYQNQQQATADPYGAGQSPVHANPENAMSNLSAFMMQSGIIPSQQQQPNSHGEAAAAAGELSSLPNLLVESGDLTQGNKMDDLSGTFSASLRLATASMGVADGGGGGGGGGAGGKRAGQGDGGAAAAAAGLNTPDVSTSAIESKSNLNRM